MSWIALGLACTFWTAFELGRLARRPAPRSNRCARAWYPDGTPIEIEEIR